MTNNYLEIKSHNSIKQNNEKEPKKNFIRLLAYQHSHVDQKHGQSTKKKWKTNWNV
jgi:hypothetical protein